MFFKQLTLMRSTVMALSAITLSMHSAAAMPSTETKAYAANSSSVASSISTLFSSSTSSTDVKTAGATVRPALTRSNATLTAMQVVQPTQTTQLRQALVDCTTASSHDASKKKSSEPSAKQLNILFHLLYDDPQNLLRIGSAALNEALDRIDKNNWPLARLMLLTANLKLIPSSTSGTGWLLGMIVPIQKLTVDYIHFAFDANNIECALYQAIEKDQWVTLSKLLKNNFLLCAIDAQIANSILFMGAIIYQQYWLIRRIANSPILGPKMTYEVCDLIVKMGRPHAVEELRKSPYLETIMKQAPTRQAVRAAAPDDEPSSDDDHELQAITACKKATLSDDLDVQVAIQQQALEKTHDCTEWLAWQERTPQARGQGATVTS